MKYIRKSLAMLLVLCMLLAMVPASLTASAEEVTPELTPVETVAPEETPAEEVPVEEVPTEETPVEEVPTEESPIVKIETDTADAAIPGNPEIPTLTDQSESGFHVNPLYEGILSADDFPEPDFSHMKGDTSAVQSDYVSTSDAAAQIRQYMLNRTEYYTLYIRSTSSSRWDVFDSTLAEALAHNGNPKEGDSLQWQYGGWEASSSATTSGSYYYYTFYIYMPYYTTASQETQLDTAVSNLLAQLNLWSKTDYEKVCGVYDYICDNVEYDYVHLNNPSYTLQFTAYAALVNKTAVCQGYAILFYRLMLELGVDARVIVGDGGGPHAWNIVELDNLYYNLDSTWDAGQYSYNYFLKCPANFMDHTREPEYETPAFHAAYPMSPTDYGEAFDPVFNALTLNTWYTATIGSSGGSAYYQFTPSVSGYYTLYSSSSYDTRCDLYNSSWGLINFDDDSGENYNFLLESWLEAGITYYYKVYFYGSSTGSFQIYLEQTDGGNSGGGEGGEISFTPLTLNQAVDVHISTGDERGFYSFTPSESGYYTLCSYSDSDTYCFIFNSAMEQVSAADDSGPGANFLKSEYIEAGETYYFEVCFYSETETGYFQICMTPAGATASGKIDNYVGYFYEVSNLTLGSDGVYRTPEGGTVYIAVNNNEEGGLFWLNNYTLMNFVDEYGAAYFDLTYWDTLCSLMDSDGYVELTQNSLYYLTRLITGNAAWGETEDYLSNYFFYDVSGGEEITILPLSVNASTAVNITEYGQLAYYSFNPQQSGNYTLAASSGGYDTYCTLYDANWNLIATDDDSGDGLDFQLEAWLEAGSTYYFEVRYLNSSLTGSFQILLTKSVSVLPLSLDVYTTVSISNYGDCAYYSYIPSESGNYTLTAYSGGLDTWCEVHEISSEGGSMLGGAEGGDFSYTAYLEAGHTYHFLVGCANTGSFQILLTRTQQEVSILPLSLNIPATVTISTGGQYAHYSFTPSESGSYTLAATSDSDTACYMYDADWNPLGYDDDNGEGLNFLLEVWLEAGVTYYFEVYYYSATATGSFEILLTKTFTDGTDRIENNGNANYVVSDLILGNDGIYRTPDNCIVYIAIANYDDGGLGWLTNFLLPGNTLYDYVDTYGTAYFDLTYWDELLELMDEYGYVVLTPTSLQYFITTITSNPEWGETAEDVRYYLFYDPTPTEDTHIHNYSTVITAPTCTEQGYTTYTCACGDSYVSDYTAALGHTYNTVVVEPTCTEGGYTTFTCSVCGDTYIGDYTIALGHSYASVVTMPTCVAGGYTTHTCTLCGDTYIDSYTDAAGHNYESVVTEPTCTEQGYTTHICTVCHNGYVDSYVGALGHSWDEGVVTLEPTEETEGICVYTCTVCHETKEEPIPVLDHVHIYESAVTAPTCTEQGYTTHTCACGYSYVDSYTPALGHAYIYKMTTAPTTTSTGVLTGTCSRCGDSTTVKMPRLNDVDYTYEITLMPTEESEGSAVYTWNVIDYGVFSVVVTVPKLSDVLLGDLNGDGEIDIFDANLVVAYYNGTTDLTEEQQAAADVNGDGEIDIFDANLIVSYYNGTLVSFPAED